jgi:hypothetical protein
MSNITNETRAQRAENAIRSYVEAKGEAFETAHVTTSFTLVRTEADLIP